MFFHNIFVFSDVQNTMQMDCYIMLKVKENIWILIEEFISLSIAAVFKDYILIASH